jgi:hypothetical protein
VLINPVVDLMLIEADESPDLDDGDTPFSHQSPNMALARPQAERNISHRDECPGVSQFLAAVAP